MNEAYEVVVTSDSDHERLVAEIWFGHQRWAVITDETPGEPPLIEFPLDKRLIGRWQMRRIPLAILETALADARRRLSELDGFRPGDAPTDAVVEHLVRKTLENES